MANGGDEAGVKGRERWRRGVWWWVGAWMIVGVYVAGYGWMIQRHTAVPYFDQQNYVVKTYALAEAWRGAQSWGERLNVARYLAAEPAMRPPLMMAAPAILWGRHATVHEMAYTWLAGRMAFLMAGVWVLSRVVGDRRWVPGALCVILGTGFFWGIDPGIYMMDLPLASLALLSAALVGWAMQRRTVWGDVMASCGTVGLFLVKSQGLVFMFPFLAVMGAERIVWAVRGRRWAAFLKWAGVMAGLLVVIGLLLASSYGAAVRMQYAWGEEGYWNTTLTWDFARYLGVGILPGWMAAALVVVGVRGVWGKKRNAALRVQNSGTLERGGWLAGAFLVGVVWWVVFTMFLTYTIEARIVWSVMPLVICVGMFLLWRWRWMGVAATGVAAGLFVLSAGVALFGKPWTMVDASLVGAVVNKQRPVAEVGERELVRRVERCVRGKEPGVAAGPSRRVIVATCGEYLDYAGMMLAARWENGNKWSGTAYEQFPFGDEGFDVGQEFDFRRAPWFVTRQDVPPGGISGRLAVNMEAVASLIQDPGSPIAGLFQRCDVVPIHVPMDDFFLRGADGKPRQDKAVIWRLKRALTAREYRDCVAFLLSQFQNARAIESMKGQLERFDRMVKQGSGVEMVSEGEIAGLRDLLVRDVRFENGLVLKGARWVRQHDAAGDGVVLEMYWEATGAITLNGNRFVHLLDAGGKIVRQGDGPQDAVEGIVQAGTCWRDAVRFAAADLKGVVRVGVGIQLAERGVVRIVPQEGVVLDWGDRRLLMAGPQ